MEENIENPASNPAFNVLDQICVKANEKRKLTSPTSPPEEEILTAAELIARDAESKAREREYLLNGNSIWEEYVASVFGGNECCDTCGASIHDENPGNKSLPWLGLGETEHCRHCGADAWHHPFFYRQIENKSMNNLVETMNAVERIYCSHTFMTREQIEKNREYFNRLLTALNSRDQNHRPNRYQVCADWRHREELFERVIQLATQVYDGDSAKAIDVYRNMSREIDDLYTIIDELKFQISTPQVKHLSKR